MRGGTADLESGAVIDKRMITEKLPPFWSVVILWHLLVTGFEIGYLQTLAFGGSVRLTFEWFHRATNFA